MTHLFVNGLTVIDCSYLHPSRGLVGESWLADLTLSGKLDGEGVVFDFSYAKKAIKGRIDDTADHALLVPLRDPRLSLRQKEDFSELEYTADNGHFIRYRCPTQGLCLIDTEIIDEVHLQGYLEGQLIEVVPDNVEKVELRLRLEEMNGSAYYHYSHGLKKHYGNCQRMAHGHRSRIEIFRDEQRDFALEKQWAAKWQDIYLGTREDLKGEQSINGETYFEFCYEGNQGPFELVIKKEICDLFDTDTTVELIAEHIFQKIKVEYPHSTFRVRAFEGIEKGALRVG